jgi:hypothetical protein
LVIVSDWIEFDHIEIDRDSVCRNLGYLSDYKLTPRVSSLIDEYSTQSYHLIEPAYSYVIKNIEGVRKTCVYIEGSIVFESEVIAKLLKPCSKVALLIVTIGSRLEDMVGQLSRHKRLLQASVLDAIGSVAVESVADIVQEKIREEAGEQGYVISRRFSPGYCDWAIRQQTEVFRAMNGNKAGVRLTESLLMVPQKSISGIIGMGTSQSKVDRYNPCHTCNKRNCIGRR